MIDPLLSAFLFVLAVITFWWGFERYRTQFVKADLLIAVVFGSGLLLLIFIPSIYDFIGALFDIRRRYVAISMFSNAGLLLIVLYIASLLRKTRGRLNELSRSISVDQAPKTDGGEKTIQVIIPAYNEAETIETVVSSLPETLLGYSVEPLVVSDGSVDETARRAKRGGTVVVEHPINQGQGGALKTGFEIAVRNDADIVVTMDGDGQHPADELASLVRPVAEDDADFVMGSRYLGEDRSENGPVRNAGIRTFTRIINVLTKSDITDCTNGFRAIRGTEIENLKLTEERFSAPELIIEARKNGLRIEEIPIRVKERGAGQTKKPQLGYAIGLTRTIITTWLR